MVADRLSFSQLDWMSTWDPTNVERAKTKNVKMTDTTYDNNNNCSYLVYEALRRVILTQLYWSGKR